MRLKAIAICATLTCCLGAALAQPAPNYDSLVQQGKTQLQAGNSAAALATGQQAIQLDANRWEAYALAGGALMNLKRYDEAIDDLTKSIERAPEAKQAGLRDLRKECILSESGVSPTPVAPVQPASTTQAEIVMWKSIENSQKRSDFEVYLSQYPNGAFSALARRAISDLDAQQRFHEEQDEVATKENGEKTRQEELSQHAGINPTTGLMWAKLADYNSGPKTFAEAAAFCANSQALEYSDWRLPSVGEIEQFYHGMGFRGGGALWTTTPDNNGEHFLISSSGKRITKKDTEKGFPVCVRTQEPQQVLSRNEMQIDSNAVISWTDTDLTTMAIMCAVLVLTLDTAHARAMMPSSSRVRHSLRLATQQRHLRRDRKQMAQIARF